MPEEPVRSPYADALIAIATRELADIDRKCAELQSALATRGAGPSDANADIEVHKNAASQARIRLAEYVPVAAHEHCPKCWVAGSRTIPLEFRLENGATSARCPWCPLVEVVRVEDKESATRVTDSDGLPNVSADDNK